MKYGSAFHFVLLSTRRRFLSRANRTSETTFMRTPYRATRKATLSDGWFVIRPGRVLCAFSDRLRSFFIIFPLKHPTCH